MFSHNSEWETDSRDRSFDAPFLSLACLAVHSDIVGMSFESAQLQFRALGTLVSAMPLCNAFLPKHVLN